MTTIIFYEKPGCSTNARQKRMLLDAGHEVVARDLLREPWTAQRLQDFFDGLPVPDWFNRAAPQVKSGEIDPARVDAREALSLMLDNPLLIRRPLLETDSWRLTGFDAEQIELRLGMNGNKEEPRSLEACPRAHEAKPCPNPNAKSNASERAKVAFEYHERTKHRPERYAAGPETLDWTSQPDPFRIFQGSRHIRLPLCAGRLAHLHDNADAAPPEFTLESIGALLELSLGLSAWKEYGPDRWALRCNPSSGNLHPTEAYVIAHSVTGLNDGLYHYASRSHELEQRCLTTTAGQPGLWIGLSSVHWREAWKYGERAFRYCQLDIGHALAALRYAAGLMGWELRLVESCNSQRLADLLGTGRDQDYAGAEREEPDLLVQVLNPAHEQTPAEPAPWDAAHACWSGQANILDPHPMYHWPVIDEVASATERNRTEATPPQREYPPGTIASSLPAPEIIMGRRSAQRFDPQFTMAAADFYRMVESLLPNAQAPWDVWNCAPAIHPVFFVHRVEGVDPGLYILVRDAEAGSRLYAELSDEFAWDRVEGCPAHLPLLRLQAGRWHKVARAVNCAQSIAADSCFSLGMLAEFEPNVQQDAWRYRQLHWEAGLVGHVLYLEAETLGLRGTGIGCFLDDAFHELLGLRNRNFQSLYHFTVGRALLDSRITTLPPYPERMAEEMEATS
jgi:nitrogenase-associated protein